MNTQECKTRPPLVNGSSNEPFIHPYNVKINKCSGSCNNINDPYPKLCDPDVVENQEQMR